MSTGALQQYSINKLSCENQKWKTEREKEFPFFFF